MNRKIALIFLCAIIKKKNCTTTKNNQLILSAATDISNFGGVLVDWELTDVVQSFHINKLENQAATHTTRRRRRGVN